MYWRKCSVRKFCVQLINYFTRKSKDVIDICRYYSALNLCIRWLIKVKLILGKLALILCSITSIFTVPSYL